MKVIPNIRSPSVDTDAYNNASDIVCERLKMNFQILLNKHPSGIWCSELPNLYKVMKWTVWLQAAHMILNFLLMSFPCCSVMYLLRNLLTCLTLSCPWLCGLLFLPVIFSEVLLLCFYLLFLWSGVRLGLIGMLATNWCIIAALDDRWVWSIRWNENWQEELKCLERTYPSDFLFNSNLT